MTRRRASANVKALALAHVEELNAKIGELETMRETLRHLAGRCRGNQRPICPILEDLAEGREPAEQPIEPRKVRRH